MATIGKAKLHGFMLNKSEARLSRRIADLNDAEIDALIASAEDDYLKSL
ncbi:hypothetical protein OAS62_07750 [Hellea sp.]|nr:hypothetical protein [Hellea sp.]